MTTALTVVEIDIDFCQLEYGVSPCTAALGTTGDKKCFNTAATCQDRDNYDAAPRTLRYCVPSNAIHNVAFSDGIRPIPSVRSVSHQPGKIRIAEDLGERARVEVSFQDHPHSDLDLDPYLSDRTDLVSAQNRGTYWGRFVARNLYLEGRPLRVFHGLAEQPFSEWEVRHYIIDSIAGPDLGGSVSVRARDPLGLLDGDKAQWPPLSPGRLAASITDTATEANLTPAGSGDSYAASGKVVIGEEVIEYTRSGDVLTLTQRASSNTEADSHDADDRVQQVAVEGPETAAKIIGKLMREGADVDPSFIDQASWDSEYEVFFGTRLYSAEIAEPMPVRKLVSELMEQVGISIWWDERAAEIRFQPLKAAASPGVVIDPDLMLADSYSDRANPTKRLSQVWVLFGKRNPVERDDEEKNYRGAVLSIAAGSETEDEYGSPSIKKIYSRWISAGSRSFAQSISEDLLERFRRPPLTVRYRVQRYTGAEVEMGASRLILGPNIQTDEGLPGELPAYITSVRSDWDALSVEAEEFRLASFDPGDTTHFLDMPDTDAFNVNLRDLHSPVWGAPDPAIPVVFRILSGQVLGSEDTETPSLDIGEWPSGIDITVEIYGTGRIAGAGGSGLGYQPDFNSVEGRDGQPGGVAVLTRYPITIDFIDATAVVAGGGGGGAAGGGAGEQDFEGFVVTVARGGGGGGGAGRVIGEAILQNVEAGTDGTLTAGGDGAAGETDGSEQGGSGGDGGDPGQDGQNGQDATGGTINGSGGTGGSAGAAIDGDSFVTVSGSGSILGPRVN